MSPARYVLYMLARLWAGRAHAVFLFAFVTLGIVAGPSIAAAQQLNLSWVDNSGGQASFIIQRALGSTGTYTQIAQVPLGVTSYTDTSVSLGTSYCYQVAAANSDGVSAFSNLACAIPSGGFTVAVTKAGSGGGTVASSPAGIDCGTTCSYVYLAGKVVTLTATPSSGSTFSGWSGGGCSGTDSCTLVGNGSVTTTATFTAGRTATPVNPVSPATVTLVVTGNPATGPYAVEAQTTLTGALTMNFFVDGSFFHQENVAKYCLFGGDGSCGMGTLGAGARVIKAQVLARGTTTVLAETQITVTEGSSPPAPGSVTLVVTGNPATGPYAVEAQTTLTGVLTVIFSVGGSFFHQESIAKYCLFGGDGSCGTGTLGTGAHVIRAQVFPQGGATILAETQITVTEGSSLPASGSTVTLVVTGNPATRPYAVEAKTTLTGALTVNFFVDGSFFRQENVAKYCLFGGDGPCGTGTLGAGAHVIRAQVLPQGGNTVLAETQITMTE